MLFNSNLFFLFFPVVCLLFFCVPKKWRIYILLIANYIFYACWDAKYTPVILLVTIVTYFCGLIIGKNRSRIKKLAKTEEETGQPQQEKQASLQKKMKAGLVLCLLINLGILFVFKYFNFFIDNIQAILSALHLSWTLPQSSLALPMGISFFTFQAIGYLVDVYRGKTKAEGDFVTFAAFLSFFPINASGPIERSDNLLRQMKQIDQIPRFDIRRIFNGLVVMLWGYFLKLVIADRVCQIADATLSHDAAWQSGAMALLFGILAFSVQIYCDFSSYSTIALGASQVLGFSVIDNFDTPYFSGSIKEFWRRWHISLSTWFRDYLYIPLGGNRKGKWRKYLNLMIVFLVSGLWHGASWTYLIWGFLHGIYQIIGDLTRPHRKKLYDKWQVKTDTLSWRLLQMGTTFTLVNFAWIFFRAESLSDALTIISRLFLKFDPWNLTKGLVYQLGLSTQEVNILFVALLVLLLVDLVRFVKKQRIDVFLQQQVLPFRWGVLLFLLIYLLVFGLYGPAFDAQGFIYSQF